MRAKILPPSPENFEILAQAIQNGEVVGMPTETVYGLAGDCFNPMALARIFESKERPTFDPLIVHVAPAPNKRTMGVDELEKLGIVDASKLEGPSRILIDRLIQAFWPGPLTLILPKNQRIPDLVTSGLPTVAVRMPEHPLAQKLIISSARPLAAPSANRFGRISPTTAQAVMEELGDRIDWILEGGTCAIGLESTILSISPPRRDEIIKGEMSGHKAGVTDVHEIRILRAGGTPKERIEEVLGFPISQSIAPDAAQSPEAPGMLESHYAPNKPFLLLDQPLSKLSNSELSHIFNSLPETLDLLASRTSLKKNPTHTPLKVGVLMLAGDPIALTARMSSLTQIPVLIRSLSIKNDLKESAHKLFSAMRELDASDTSVILAEPCQIQEGLGFAIADRLKRASASSRTVSNQ